MFFRVLLAVWASKLSRIAIRILGKSGGAFPGQLAMKICPDVLSYLARDVHCICVTGTNGKTTTTRMIEQMLIDDGKSYYFNRSGANLLVGIVTEFAINATLTGKKRADWAILECDEAAFKHIARYVDPDYVILTNVFRDQLDRYGAVADTLENIAIGLENSPHATIMLNGDCSMSASLPDRLPDNRILFYGINVPVYKERVREASDAPYCIRCQHPYEYKYITYGHLGDYYCPNCGYKRPTPDLAVTEVKVCDEKQSEVVMTWQDESYDVVLGVPGAYNIYNAAGVMALGKAMGVDSEVIIGSLAHFEAGFGRMEEFDLAGVSTRMILAKNPAGCNQVLNFLSNLSEEAVFVVLLNDNVGDGKDVSWIWDVDFEVLTRIQDKLSKIYVGGIRAYEMATRLKYAEVDPDKLEVMTDYEKLLEAITGQDKQVILMPTYTAMMDLRGLISKKYGYKNFWE